MIPKLLFLSPTMPRETGNGLAMRAGAVMRALGRHAEVSLVVVPLYDSGATALTPSLRAACHEVIVAHSIPEAIVQRRFDMLHVFRLSLFETARPLLARAATVGMATHLDLDDLESATHSRLATLARGNGAFAQADILDGMARQYAALEQIALRMFDRVYVCAESDRRALSGHGSASLELLPNVVAVPTVVASRDTDQPFRVLFVGTLGYYPNDDGVRWFLRDVLPEIRRHVGARCEVEIVGRGAGDALRQCATEAGPGTVLTGEIADVAEAYRRASAVVVPVRGGGGTRIKVLEAFAHGRPVVSTRVGCEGIDVEPGVQLLVAEDATAFAAACVRLMVSPMVAEALVAEARALVVGSYSFAALETTMARLFA